MCTTVPLLAKALCLVVRLLSRGSDQLLVHRPKNILKRMQDREYRDETWDEEMNTEMEGF